MAQMVNDPHDCVRAAGMEDAVAEKEVFYVEKVVGCHQPTVLGLRG